jgi:hypothetical protein
MVVFELKNEPLTAIYRDNALLGHKSDENEVPLAELELLKLHAGAVQALKTYKDASANSRTAAAVRVRRFDFAGK